MQIEVNFHYAVIGRRNGNVVNSTRFFASSRQFVLRDVPSGFAPVAVEWNAFHPLAKTAPPSYGSEANWGIAPVGGLQHTRWFEGRHWLQCLEVDTLFDADNTAHMKVADTLFRDGSPPLTVDALEANALTLGDRHVFGQAAPRGRVYPVADGHDPVSEYEDVEVNDLEGVVDVIEKRLREYIAVNGVVYRQCPEPKYVQRRAVDDGDSPFYLAVSTSIGEIVSAIRGQKPIHSISQFDDAFAEKELFSSPAIRVIDAGRAPVFFLDEAIDEEKLFDKIMWAAVDRIFALADRAAFGEFTDPMLDTIRPLKKAKRLKDLAARLAATEEALPPFLAEWRDFIGKNTPASSPLDLDSLENVLSRLGSRHISIETTGGPRP